MIIEFSRIGGFGGCKIGTTIDTDTLPAQEAQQLEEWVGEVTEKPNAKQKIDRFGYLLRITKGRKVSLFQFGEGKHPKLVKYLLEHTMSAPATST